MQSLASIVLSGFVLVACASESSGPETVSPSPVALEPVSGPTWTFEPSVGRWRSCWYEASGRLARQQSFTLEVEGAVVTLTGSNDAAAFVGEVDGNLRWLGTAKVFRPESRTANRTVVVTVDGQFDRAGVHLEGTYADDTGRGVVRFDARTTDLCPAAP